MASVTDVIKRQLDTSGNLILKASSILSDEQFLHEPAAGASMAWTLGHLAALQDWAIHRVFLAEEPKISRQARELFKGGRSISDDDREFVTGMGRRLETTFAATQQRTIELLHDFDTERWNEPTPSGCRFPTLGALWEHLATHNFWHLGHLAASIPGIAGTAVALVAPRFYSVDPAESSIAS